LKVIEEGRKVLAIEARAIDALSESLDGRFEDAVELILSCKGKVVVTGIGKSGIICRKIAATLSSTGTPAFFLHPAEGAHGDLGVLSPTDVVLAVSNSGESSELLGLLPLIRRMGIKMISITGVENSTLARRADLLLPIKIESEGCPLNLAPMASTTVTLALGDAIAAALMVKRGLSKEDFALVHPAGSLGRRLTLTLEDLMVSGAGVPSVTPETTMREAIPEISVKGLGFTGVFGAGGELLGVITDGDLRRGIASGESFLDVRAEDVMSKDPVRAEAAMLAVNGLRLMEEHSITSLFVEGESGGILGVVHMHHILKAGL